MGTLLGSYVADGAWLKANDATGGAATRWLTAEALRWLNNGQREIVNQLPRANAVTATPTVVAGTRQTLSGLGLTTGVQIIDVTANFNTGATVRGRAITKRDRADFDDQIPSWHSDTAAEADHWMQDDRDPKAFYIYPAIASAAGKLEVVYAANPTDLASLASAISLDDIYANALEAFVLFSFYSKDATYAKGMQLAATYYSLFKDLLGVRGTNIAGIAAKGDSKGAQ